MTILNEGPEAKYNHVRPDTKAKDLKRIADALEKLVELQTPKTVELSNASITIAATDGYDVANKIAERDAEGNVKGFKRGGYTGDSKTHDWRAHTIELKREKNKLAVRIAEIEGELKRRAERTMTERQIIDTITESLDLLNNEDMLDGFPFTSVNQPECKRTFTIELKPGATLLYVDGVISAESANKMAEEFLQVFEEARAAEAE